MSSPPFVDAETSAIDTAQPLVEIVPLARLILVFVGIAFVPLALTFFVLGDSIVGVVVTALAQFVLAVGTGIVLMYAVARGIDLAGA
jgi:hypothetical protein